MTSSLRLSRFAVLALVGLTLVACDSDDPVQPPDDTVVESSIAVDVEPDWATLPWTLRGPDEPVEGVGDSLMVFATVASCTLTATEGDGLLLDGTTRRIVTPSPAEITTIALDYTQQPWQQTYGEDVNASLFDGLQCDNEDLIVCGRYDTHPWLQRVDRNGEVVWSEVESASQADAYYTLLTGTNRALSEGEAFLAIASGLHTEFSWRTGDGAETAWAQVDSLSFGGLVTAASGQMYLWGTRTVGDFLCTELAMLSSAGTVLSRREVAGGEGHRLAVGLAPGPAGGLLAVRTRDVGEDITHYAIEVLSLDAEGELVGTAAVASGEAAFGLGTLACRDGDVLISYLSHDDADPTASEVIRVSSGGDVLWTRRLDGTGFEELYPVGETDEGHVFLVGASYDYGASINRVRIIELDAVGSVIANREFDTGTVSCRLSSRGATWDSGEVLCGTYGNWHDGLQNGWIVRLDASGYTLPSFPTR